MPPVRRGLPNRRDYLTLPSAAEFLQAASRITGAPAAQLASQSHVVPREFAERENAARPPPLVRRQDSHADLDRPRRNGSATTPRHLAEQISSRRQHPVTADSPEGTSFNRRSRRCRASGEIEVFPARLIVGRPARARTGPGPLVLLRFW